MNTEPEPLAAILAEMRDERIIHIEDADATRCLLRNLADRIEAAVARERREYERLHECFWKEGTIQNFVRQLLNHSDDIRDAKPELAEAIRHFAQELIKAATPIPGNAATMRAALERAIDAIQTMIALYDEEHTSAVQIGATWKRSDTSAVNAIVEQARAALAAPPRNCDRCATAEEAYSAWASNGEMSAICDWLFAPTEGGAK